MSAAEDNLAKAYVALSEITMQRDAAQARLAEEQRAHEATRKRIDAVDAELRAFGIEYPLGANGVNDLAAMASGRLEDLQTAEAELERQRPVVEAAQLWRDQCEVHKANHDALIAAVDALGAA